MKAVFRVDASSAIGTGHFYRCMTLAAALEERGWSIAFAFAEVPDRLAQELSVRGYQKLSLAPFAPRQPESLLAPSVQSRDAMEVLSGGALREDGWFIVDHYGLDEAWERIVRSAKARLLVIDDLANRRHQCDLLLDQNPGFNKAETYRKLLPPEAGLLLGPMYALLRREFLDARASVPVRSGPVRRILVSFGGVDPTGESLKAVSALRRVKGQVDTIDVVAGAENIQWEALSAACGADARVRLIRSTNSMSELMAQSDLAIGACGATSWERCAMFLPALGVVVANNQREIAAQLSAAGAARILGWHEMVSADDIANAVAELSASPKALQGMSEAAGVLVDAKGTERVVAAMEALCASPHLLH